MKITKLLLTSLLLLSISFSSTAQRNWDIEWQAGLTINFNMKGDNQYTHRGFPGFKLFTSLMLKNYLADQSFAHLGSTLTLSHKMISNSMNPLIDDYQLDFSNAFSLTWNNVLNDTLPEGIKYLRTFGINHGYNFNHQHDYLLAVSTVFNWNSSQRNQVVGAFTGTYKNFSATYYNDGAFPVNLLPISDKFDRYWTSGVHLFYHGHDKNYNWIELSMDQYTGYKPKLYEFASLFGIELAGYKSPKDTDRDITDLKTSTSANSGNVDLRLCWDPNLSLNIGVLGSFTMWGKYYGFQDMIHLNNGLPLHPNRDGDKYYLGFNYNSSIWNGIGTF